MMAITTSSQKEAFPLAGRLSQLGTRHTWHQPKLHMRSRLAGGIGTAHHGTRKGYSDSMQQTGPIMSGQLYQDANMQLAYNSLKTFQSPNSGLAYTAYNPLKIIQTAYLQPAQTLSRRYSYPQISSVRLAYGHRNPLIKLNSSQALELTNTLIWLNYGEIQELVNSLIGLNCRESREMANSLMLLNYNESLELANSLIIPRTCTTGSWKTKRGGSPNLKVPTKFVATCTPGIQRNVRRSFPVNQQITDKKKGRTANPTLWNGCFSSHEENQQSTVLDNARSPDLAYGDSRGATLLYERNQHFATQQDNHTGISGDVDRPSLSESVNLPSLSDLVQPLRLGVLQLFRKTSIGETYENFVGQSSDDSLDFLRCSAFSLRPQASSTQAEKLAFGLSGLSRSTLSSMLSISSWGKRICFKYERLFLFPVAIFLRSMLLVIYTPYSKFANDKTIDVHTPLRIRYTHTLSTGKAQITKPGSASTLTGPLTTSDSKRIEVAMFDHTTHPQGRNSLTRNKFTWRFLALSRTDRKAKPCRLSVVAHSEREARQALAPHFILSLAARLPLQGVEEISIPSTVEKTSMEVTYVA